MGRFDGTHIEVFLNHRIQGREITHSLAGLVTSAFGFIEELLIKLGACLFEVRLVQIEDVIDLQFGIDGIFGTLFLRHLLVIVVLDAFLRLLVDAGEGSEHHRGTLLALVDAHMREFVAIGIHSRHRLAVLALGKVHADNAVESGITGGLPAVLFLHEHEDDAVHAVVVAPTEVHGHLSCLRREPRLLPVALEIADLLNHQLGKGGQSTVFRTLSVRFGSIVGFLHTLWFSVEHRHAPAYP